MFILPEDEPNSPNVRRIEQTLQEYKSIENKHGNMVFTGKVEPIEMNEFNKDMEFRKLAVYYTANCAFAFGLPKGKVQAILGLEMKEGTDDLADSAYWRRISEAQDYIETLFNTQLFIPRFSVKIKFNRSYKQDDIREAEVLSIKTPVLNDLNMLLKSYDKKLTLQYIQTMIGMEDSDLEEGAVEDDILIGQNPKLPRQQTTGTNQTLSRKKKTEQNNKMENTKVKPLGR